MTSAIAERGFRRGNARVHLVVRQPEVALGERLALAEALLLVLGEQLMSMRIGRLSHARACETILNLCD